MSSWPSTTVTVVEEVLVADESVITTPLLFDPVALAEPTPEITTGALPVADTSAPSRITTPALLPLPAPVLVPEIVMEPLLVVAIKVLSWWINTPVALPAEPSEEPIKRTAPPLVLWIVEPLNT